MICDHYTKVEWMRYEDFVKARDAKEDEGFDENAIDATELFPLWNAQLEQEMKK
jgi:hypothetical protein